MPSSPKPAKRKRKPLVLTERDQTLLRTVADYGVLSTEQAYRLSFPSVSRARKRLRLLWQHGLVKRHVRPVRMGEGSSALLYTLTRKGQTAMAGGGLEKLAARVGRSIGEHALKINDFRTALAVAVRRIEGLRLNTWGHGKDFQFSATIASQTGLQSVPIVPDAFFVIDGAGREFCYFLEIDRGTAPHSRIKEKLSAYSSLWQSRQPTVRLGIRSFRVLYVTTTENRLRGMLRALRDLTPSVGRADLFSLTCFARYSMAQPDAILGPIWQSVDPLTGGTRSVRPFPGPVPSTLPIAPSKPPVGVPDAGAR